MSLPGSFSLSRQEKWTADFIITIISKTSLDCTASRTAPNLNGCATLAASVKISSRVIWPESCRNPSKKFNSHSRLRLVRIESGHASGPCEPKDLLWEQVFGWMLRRMSKAPRRSIADTTSFTGLAVDLSSPVLELCFHLHSRSEVDDRGKTGLWFSDSTSSVARLCEILMAVRSKVKRRRNLSLRLTFS